MEKEQKEKEIKQMQILFNNNIKQFEAEFKNYQENMIEKYLTK